MSEILHVSDTALMVAACRAMDFADDPFAGRLAGERGMAIARAQANLQMLRYGVAVRSRFLDELVLYAVTELGVRTVVNLGAGLDTRPWRLDLPAELRWVEVDFPAMLAYKAGVLAGEATKCAWTQMAADLADADQRQAVFAAAGSGPGLVISEGLLMYLSRGLVADLAGAPRGAWHWLTDVTSAAMARATGLSASEAVERVRSDGHMSGEGILGVLASSGWRVLEHRSYLPDGGAGSGDPSGVTLFSLAV